MWSISVLDFLERDFCEMESVLSKLFLVLVTQEVDELVPAERKETLPGQLAVSVSGQLAL